MIAVTNSSTARQHAQSVMKERIGNYKDPIVVWDYRMPSQSFALHFAALYTRGAHVDAVRAARPRDVSVHGITPDALAALVSEYLANGRTVLLAVPSHFDASRYELTDVVTHHDDKWKRSFFIARILSVRK
jgi:hypothetical protein